MSSTMRAMACRPPRVLVFSSFSSSSSFSFCYQAKALLPRLGVVSFRNQATVGNRSVGHRAAYYSSSLFTPFLDSTEFFGRTYQKRTLTRASCWSSERSPYETLELQRDADDDKIKIAYRRLAKYYHPDVYDGRGTLEEGETAEARFIKIQAAYELLIDEEKRSQYDREHRLNPMKASLAWMEWLIKKRKAFDQRGDMAIAAWAEQQQREMVLRARLRSRSKVVKIETYLLPLVHKCIGQTSEKLMLGKLVITGFLRDYLMVKDVLSRYSSLSEVRNVELAVAILRQVDVADTYMWNSTIRLYEQNGSFWEAILLFKQMLGNQVVPDKFTFPFVLKACTIALALKEGEQIHCRVLKSPYRFDVFVECYLVDMYAKCRKIDSARSSFNAIKFKNIFCWNVMIDGYVKHGDSASASQLFDTMPERDLFSWNVMIDGYVKNGQTGKARQLLDEMKVKDVVSWNSMIEGYVRCGDMDSASELFVRMPLKDALTWGIMLNGYARSGRVEFAHNLFEKLPYKNSVVWNSLIHGYAKSKNTRDACKLFELMSSRRNLTSWNIILDACVKYEEVGIAETFFNAMPVRDVISWNIMIDGYIRAGYIEPAERLFGTMTCKDVVTWNSMMVGYKKNGQSEKVIELYNLMQSSGEKPDSSTLATVLSAVADLSLFSEGRRIHYHIKENKISVDGVVGVALVNLYFKCGHTDLAMETFKSIPYKTRDHWNGLLSGAATHGYGCLAISCFEYMEESMVVPDDITFIALLNACSHAGLVHEGYIFFKLMSSKYDITPSIQHYGCMVDLLSRAGYLEEALALVNNMPYQPNDVVWRTLLGASCNYGNTKIAEHAAGKLVELMPDDSSSYVLMSNIYGSMRKCWRYLETDEKKRCCKESWL